MPSRHPVALLASVAVLGLGATACEKQNPIVTVTAGGVVVKAKAVEYCRGDDCRKTNETPTLKIKSGDVLGIDVPRSLAEQGWRIAPSDAGPEAGPFHKDHYRAFPIPQDLQPGTQTIEINRDPAHGKGVWKFTLVVE